MERGNFETQGRTQIYNITTNKWREGPDMPSGWSGGYSHAVVYADELYVAGGSGSDGGIAKLISDPVTWEVINDTNTAHTGYITYFPEQVIHSDSCKPGKGKSNDLAHLYL